ncbi:MAG: hypothetical protein J6A83_04620 [Clostridia bacterium]|nr:hypothetical protein [Clostridia bacterium]
MKRKIYATLALLLALSLCFSGCLKQSDNSGDETGTSAADSTEKNTSTAATTPQATTAPRGDVLTTHTIKYTELGLVPYSFSTDEYYVADAAPSKSKDSIDINIYGNGTAMISIQDYWGNIALVRVIADKSEIRDIELISFEEENSVNIAFCGARGDGITNDTRIIQNAINSLPNGGTIYFPAGVYLVDRLVLGDGITLKLQGRVENVEDGYTDELAARVEAGEFAIIKDSLANNNLILNHDPNGSGMLGTSNISIIGGMIDLNGALSQKVQVDVNQYGPEGNASRTDTCGIAFSCGENILFENVIFKDSYNAHVMQLAGMKNLTIRNCMFAGYVNRAQVKGDITSALMTRESIQLEYTHSGAMPPSTFEAGEFNYCENIRITGCYFGDSDEAGYHSTPIGQHGQMGRANVTGLEVTDCVFDNPYYCAFRAPNYCGVTIKNNKFISDIAGYENGYFIQFFMTDSNGSYFGKSSTGAGTTITAATAYEHDGLHNILVSDNDFLISGSSNKRVISIVSTAHLAGAKTVSGLMKKVEGQTYGASYSGFVKSTNFASDVIFSDNDIKVTVTNYYKDYLAHFGGIAGLVVSGNKVDTVRQVSLPYRYNNTKGIKVDSEVNSANAKKLTFVTALTNYYVILPTANGGTIKIAASSTTARTLSLYAGEHIKLEYIINSSHNVEVRVVCDEGYSFGGWVLHSDSSEYSPSSNVSLRSNLQLRAVCK